jgi:cobalt/nickel transport system permease protein
MHIAEGVLSPQALGVGAGLTALGTIYGVRKLKYEHVPRAALLSAAFFVASLIHIPIGPSSAHLILNGLVGLILGYASFPIILIGLLLQAVFFGFGGFTGLGVNTLNMALPAMFCYFVFRKPLSEVSSYASIFTIGFLAGFLATSFSCIMLMLFLYFSNESFEKAAMVVGSANIPVIGIEAFITGFAAVYLKKVKPEIFNNGF